MSAAARGPTAPSEALSFSCVWVRAARMSYCLAIQPSEFGKGSENGPARSRPVSALADWGYGVGGGGVNVIS